MHTTFRIENRTIFKILFAILVFLGLLNVATLVKTQLIWIAAAFFIAIALNPAVETVRRYMPRKSRPLALAVVMLGALSLIFFLIYTFLPLLIKQTAQLIETAPAAIRDLQNTQLPLSIENTIKQYQLDDTIKNSLNTLVKGLAGATGSVLSVAQGIFNGVIAAVTIIVLAIFMLLEGPSWMKRFWDNHPAATLERNRQLVREMYDAISGYFTGLLLIAALAGFAATIMMAIVGIPYSIPLGLVVGIFGLIPYIGATLAAVLVCLVALFTSPTAAIIMAIYFIIYQQVENNILQPVIQGRSTDLSPLIVTIAILLGTTLAGLFGALVAIPVAACIKVLASYWLKHHVISGQKRPVKHHPLKKA